MLKRAVIKEKKHKKANVCMYSLLQYFYFILFSILFWGKGTNVCSQHKYRKSCPIRKQSQSQMGHFLRKGLRGSKISHHCILLSAFLYSKKYLKSIFDSLITLFTTYVMLSWRTDISCSGSVYLANIMFLLNMAYLSSDIVTVNLSIT